MAKRAVLDHPKFARLKMRLQLNKSCTLGYLETLWQFTGRYTPQGNVGKYADSEIEAWLEWEGDAGFLLASFIACGWVDIHVEHRLVVHDWHDHADNTTKTALKRAGLDLLFCRSALQQSFNSVATESQQSHNPVSTLSQEGCSGVATMSQQCRDSVSTVLRPPEPEPVPVPEPGRNLGGASGIDHESHDFPPENWMAITGMLRGLLPEPLQTQNMHAAMRRFAEYAVRRQIRRWPEETIRAKAAEIGEWQEWEIIAAIEDAIRESSPYIRRPRKALTQNQRRSMEENYAAIADFQG